MNHSTPTPPAGYEILPPGAKIRTDDLFCGDRRLWVRTASAGQIVPIPTEYECWYCRPMSEDRPGWMQTFTGKKFYPLDPDPKLIHLEDIAHSLSLQCRFGGHCKRFYSVAQHSIHVAELCAQQWGQERRKDLLCVALMHDATEAYLGDMIRPLKALVPQYQEAEQRLWEAICTRFNMNPALLHEIKHFDNVALMTERRDLVGEAVTPWAPELEALTPDPEPLHFLEYPPTWHEIRFRNTFLNLTK